MRKHWKVSSIMTCESLYYCHLEECAFMSDLDVYSYGYQITGNGRWISMMLKRPKKKGGMATKKKSTPVAPVQPTYSDDDDDDEVDEAGRDMVDDANSGNEVCPWSRNARVGSSLLL